ncbi:hypothetical protein AVEN_167534-1 [Araneus ventricosus]|uniref:Uncharacterized protein n=1 Tax=Araneus ventricosus TaxID=182803 RepID=A0A4Y2NZS2_ARAVE|nr:hypothetical protein AVEN_167534-1 [Araneus ventricosus]
MLCFQLSASLPIAWNVATLTIHALTEAACRLIRCLFVNSCVFPWDINGLKFSSDYIDYPRSEPDIIIAINTNSSLQCASLIHQGSHLLDFNLPSPFLHQKSRSHKSRRAIFPVESTHHTGY